jgi:hypothetical protein
MHLVAIQRGWYCAISMSCVTLPKWHGRGHRFDPDQVHQLFQQLTGLPKFSRVHLGSNKSRSWLEATSVYREKSHLSLHQQM